MKSKVALAKMLEAGEVNDEDIVLEAGPGKGALTEKLLAKAGKVLAVEKDGRLISFLQEKFAPEIAGGKLEIIHGDILNIKLEAWNIKLGEFKIIANIPYYITGQFLRKFLAGDCEPERIVVMVQKEIAQRIVANNEKESLLSISVKAYGKPKMIMKVDKENFSPAPKVDSTILLIGNISKKLFRDNQIEEKDFFIILHAGFAHKRKMLFGNLKEHFGLDNLEEIFATCQIDLKARAEDLPLEKWVNLTKNLNS